MLNRPGGFRDPGEPEEYCRGFQVFDKDMTGFIGVGQLRYSTMCSSNRQMMPCAFENVTLTRNLAPRMIVLTNLGEKMTDDEVDELLKAVDTSSGEINYTGQSFLDAVFPQSQESHPVRTYELFLTRWCKPQNSSEPFSQTDSLLLSYLFLGLALQSDSPVWFFLPSFFSRRMVVVVVAVCLGVFLMQDERSFSRLCNKPSNMHAWPDGRTHDCMDGQMDASAPYQHDLA